MLSFAMMSYSRALLPLLLAAILGLGAGDGLAQSSARRSAQAVPATPDEAIVQARHAAARGDRARFELAAAQAAGHPLSGYLDYWRLRLRLSEPSASGRDSRSGSDGGADADIRAFIERQPDSLVADLLRRDWMLDLGRRGAWKIFDEQYAQWILRDDTAVHCRGWQGAAARGGALPREAEDTLFKPRDQGEACGALIEALARDGTLTPADLRRLLRVSLEANAPTSIRRVGTLLELPASELDAALERPAVALRTASSPEIALIAAVRLARQDPERAVAALEDARMLGATDRSFALSQAAAHAMRRLMPQALQWTRQSLDAQVSDETLDWLARAALRDSDWRTLHAVIEKMSLANRREPAWVYWHARAHQALGRPEQAQAALRSIAGQFHFYGQLAAEELGQLTVTPPSAPRPTDEEFAAPARNPGFARALKFYELGLRFEGNREWNYQLRGMDDRQLLAAAHWACRKSVLDRCVNTADRTRQEHDFSLRFVTPFLEQLQPAARERELDPAWVYGLIRQESRFIMNVRSSANAQGLMQIIPPTARWIARKLGVTDFRLEDLNTIETNLSFGTFYLKNVLDDLDGSPVLASAGYNAGPNRPRSWRNTLPGKVEGAVFAEIIPFTETRDYVKNVLSNATFYAALLSGEPQSLKRRLGSVAPSSSAGRADLP
ncbi:lytic transglycosylase domain-containing protein [Quisquiliibacterium transsilvanicum]|uniref:Soluble lytic murein transglycosylase n=1 Tax=Quisquiliibacterium transsilvanicum TaxID=1549638 RepID=A0A7W8HL92_9BURK|nr:lytic transglycosylase domain-containing protein [Quisquiliibacterium transsilvanicum]MBB5273203.1 soluble lytic murein transglycosylase [Quisquiliibacterium transsilvanicum]